MRAGVVEGPRPGPRHPPRRGHPGHDPPAARRVRPGHPRRLRPGHRPAAPRLEATPPTAAPAAAARPRPPVAELAAGRRAASSPTSPTTCPPSGSPATAPPSPGADHDRHDPITAVLDQLAAHREQLTRSTPAKPTITPRSAAGSPSSPTRPPASAAPLQDARCRARPAHRTQPRPTAERDGYRPGPAPAWWKLAADDRQEPVARLRAWVEQVYRPGYGHLAATLGPCWDAHDLCLYGLDILAELWSVLYLQPAPQPRAAVRPGRIPGPHPARPGRPAPDRDQPLRPPPQPRTGRRPALEQAMTDATLRQALAFAARGWPVFPCQPGQKIPATRHGFRDATTDHRADHRLVRPPPRLEPGHRHRRPRPRRPGRRPARPGRERVRRLRPAPRRRAAGRRRRLRPHPQRRAARLLHRLRPAQRPPARPPPGLPLPRRLRPGPALPGRRQALPADPGTRTAAAAWTGTRSPGCLQPQRQPSGPGTPQPGRRTSAAWPGGSPARPKATATPACSGPPTAPWKPTRPPTSAPWPPPPARPAWASGRSPAPWTPPAAPASPPARTRPPGRGRRADMTAATLAPAGQTPPAPASARPPATT